MKHLKYIFMAFTVALLATSCSQDELLEDGGIEEVPVTFTATVDYAIETQDDDAAGNMKQAATRATSTEDDAPSRFYAQAVSNGTLSKVVEGTRIDDNTYSFTLQVAKDTESDYMFWADNAAPGDEPADLRSVSYTMGGIAFAATAQGTPETVDENVKLQHVVAKVTLKTTTDVTFESISEEMTDANLAADSEVLTTYLIPNPDDKAVTFSAHDLAQTIDVVHLVANTNVTLQGDLSESNPKWGATKEYVEKQINYFFKQKDGTTSEGIWEGDAYRFYLQEEKIADLEAVLSAIFHKDVELNLTNGTIFDEVLDNDYTFAIRSNTNEECLDILINNNKTYVVSYNPIYIYKYKCEYFNTLQISKLITIFICLLKICCIVYWNKSGCISSKIPSPFASSVRLSNINLTSLCSIDTMLTSAPNPPVGPCRTDTLPVARRTAGTLQVPKLRLRATGRPASLRSFQGRKVARLTPNPPRLVDAPEGQRLLRPSLRPSPPAGYCHAEQHHHSEP